MNPIKSNLKKCVFCQEILFGKSNFICKIATCGHVFHKNCLDDAMKKLSHCPICQTRLLPRHIGPVHLYDDDIPLSFNANDRENQPNNMQTVHETNDAKTICTDNENNQIAETASNSLLISKNADANKTNESLTNNSLIAEHVSVNVSNDEFMDALDVTEHLNFDLETEAIESSSNQQCTNDDAMNNSGDEMADGSFNNTLVAENDISTATNDIPMNMLNVCIDMNVTNDPPPNQSSNNIVLFDGEDLPKDDISSTLTNNVDTSLDSTENSDIAISENSCNTFDGNNELNVTNQQQATQQPCGSNADILLTGHDQTGNLRNENEPVRNNIVAESSTSNIECSQKVVQRRKSESIQKVTYVGQRRKSRAKSVDYDRNVRINRLKLGGSSSIGLRQPKYGILRRSSRIAIPVKRYNFGVVQCCVCKRKFSQDISIEHYGGEMLCSVECFKISE